MAKRIFERIEKKYVVPKYKYEELMQEIKKHMKLDDYGKHTISNIYFDTDNFYLIRHSLEKPLYKEKLRLRAYGVPSDKSEVFIEIKKKYQHVVYKRRIALKLNEARAYLYNNISPEKLKKEQIFKEIEYMKHNLDLEPKVYIAYDRLAYYRIDDTEFRITFDTNIVARDHNLDITKRQCNIELLGKDFYIMEVKINMAMPLWLCHILSKLNIYQSSFSKYGEYYKLTIYKNINIASKRKIEVDRFAAVSV